MSKHLNQQMIRLQMKQKYRRDCVHNYCHNKYLFCSDNEYICEVPEQLAVMLFETGKYIFAPIMSQIKKEGENENSIKKKNIKKKKENEK